MTIQAIPFAIASDEAVSKAYSRQRLLNLYAERTPTKAKSAVLILGRPGLKPWAVAGVGPVRGSDVMGGVLYVVSGGTFYRVSTSGIATAIGTIGGSGFVCMANNGSQMIITTGKAWVAYINDYFLVGKSGNGAAYLYSGSTLSQITDPNIFLTGDGKFQWSALGDGSTWDALDFATAESIPGPLIRGIVDGSDVLLFKAEGGEPWYDSGSDDVFDRQNQATIRKGIMGIHTAALLDNTTFWIGKDKEAGGAPIAYRLDGGFAGQRISTHAVESAFATVTDWSAVRCISYIVNGHAFFHVILTDQPSWVYDVATGLWHEEETYGLGRWQGASHSFAYGKHIVGSCNSGDLFELDEDYFYDGASTPIEAEMVSVPIGEDASYKTNGLFQIDMETGVGTATGQGSDPQVMMQYSDDRGRSWSSEKWRSAGQSGEYNKRVRWQQLGRFRSRVFKIRMTDPVKRAFINYFADIS